MQFLADENIRRDVVLFLKGQGHDVETVEKQNSDKAIAKEARRKKSILLTNDLDFANTIGFPPSLHSGIVIFRLHPPQFKAYVRVLEKFFALYNAKRIKGKTLIISENDLWEIE